MIRICRRREWTIGLVEIVIGRDVNHRSLWTLFRQVVGLELLQLLLLLYQLRGRQLGSDMLQVVKVTRIFIALFLC